MDHLWEILMAILAAVVAPLAGWWGKMVQGDIRKAHGDIKKATDDLAAHKLHVAEKYASKEDFSKVVESIHSDIRYIREYLMQKK